MNMLWYKVQNLGFCFEKWERRQGGVGTILYWVIEIG